MVKKQKLVLKTSFEDDELYKLLRDAAFAKHRRNKNVINLLRKKSADIVVRLEIKGIGKVSGHKTAILVEIFESLPEG